MFPSWLESSVSAASSSDISSPIFRSVCTIIAGVVNSIIRSAVAFMCSTSV